MKKFFSIEEKKYVFEWNDITAFFTVVNVILVMSSFAWAPWIAIGNCIMSLLLNIRCRTHINLYIIQIALVILNIYFLK